MYNSFQGNGGWGREGHIVHCGAVGFLSLQCFFFFGPLLTHTAGDLRSGDALSRLTFVAALTLSVVAEVEQAMHRLLGLTGFRL